ncbi:MAG: ATP synthase F1 subunit gamma [Ignavibacterium sp.]|nr:ATP synthase F1 subunit gamma [Ignavibacterium sp.]MCX7610651.1 ATP synthase F1 subunit gamma [Ignavibacterium sp.]MDW8375545.1 ATP synthase F1 subunit gamma [Ignavibacteriales bacterium]
MATLRDIKQRIKGVKNTQQITKAMKMVAAAKLRRAQDAIINARPYAKKIQSLISDLTSDDDINSNPLFIQRQVKNVAIVVITADRGLCGAFNTNIIREANRFIDEEILKENLSYSLFCVGKKGKDFFTKRNFNVVDSFVGIFSSLDFSFAQRLSDRLITGYINGEFDKVIVIFNEFKSIIQQKVVVEQYLPILVDKNTNRNTKASLNYIYEPDRKSIFDFLIPKNLRAQLWRFLLESNAAEFAARMTAMDNATTNAKELIRTLNLKYNKERQASITKEILEIVSGANALKSSQ